MNRVGLALCTLALWAAPATADSPKPTVAQPSTSDADTQAARRRAQLAAPVVNSAAALSTVQKAADNRARAEWKQVTSKAGRFAVTFPGAPKERSFASDADSEIGSVVEYELVFAPDQVYVAGSAEIRNLKSGVDNALEDAMQGAAEQLHGTLKNVVRQVSGSPAIQGRITLPNGAIVEVKFLAVDDMVYGVAAGDRSGDGLEDAERFLASLSPTTQPKATLSPTNRPPAYAQLTAALPPSDTDIPAVIEFGRPTINGSLEAVVITRYLKRNTEKLRYCYQKQLREKPRVKGTVTVELTVAANGSVSASNAVGIDTAVASCFAEVARNIEFPATASGGTVKYPFRLRPSARK